MRIKNRPTKTTKVTVSQRRPRPSSVAELRRLLNVMSWCGVSCLAVTDDLADDDGEVTVRCSAMMKRYSWVLRLAVVCVNIASVAAPRLSQNSAMAVVFMLGDQLLYHVAGVAILCSLRDTNMKAYVDILTLVDEKAGHVSSGAGTKKVLACIALCFVCAVMDCFIFLYSEIVPDYSAVSGYLVCVGHSAAFLQFLLVNIAFLLLTYLPTARMSALEERLRKLTDILGVSRVEDYWLSGATNAQKMDVHVVGQGVSGSGQSGSITDSLFLYSELQESARSAAKLVEEAMSLPVLCCVTVAFVKIFFNCLHGIRMIERSELLRSLSAAMRLVTNFGLLATVAEACQQFYLVDARVSRALQDASARAGEAGGARACELWSRLRALAAARTPTYTAFRLLVVDRALLSSISATAVTFTIMLFQLKSGLQVGDIQ